jgi:catechol 2,3-dioxygenase-like lactoylglutathione lyase family enzyme
VSISQASHQQATPRVRAAAADMKLEVVVLPVSDVDRAKRFYEGLGWRLDADFAGEDWRAVQVTPPGSPCSIHFGKGVTTAVPGSVQGLILVVDDIETARAELIAKGVEVSEPFHFSGIRGPRLAGPDPDRRSYASYASFRDPDGNSWVLQEVKARLPGRGLSLDPASLTEILQEAEVRHGSYESGAPKHHWSTWYAAYAIARERGRTPDDAAAEAAAHVSDVLASQQ